MSKQQLSERDICTKFITPALEQAGWDIATQIREEFPLTKGRIIVRGELHTRAQHKRADYVLFYKPNIPIAVIEAKDNKHSIGDGMQQGLSYAEMLQVPFVFSSNLTATAFFFIIRLPPTASSSANWLSMNFHLPTYFGNGGRSIRV
jgi:type I restriction enzyme R subunit